VEYWRPLVDRWSPTVERWGRRAQTAPSTVKVYALLTVIGSAAYINVTAQPQNALFELALVGVIVVTILIRSQRGWGASVLLAGASTIYGMALWPASEGVVLALYGVPSLVLLISPTTLRWVRPFEPRSTI
jgi:hypothetical protein